MTVALAKNILLLLCTYFFIATSSVRPQIKDKASLKRKGAEYAVLLHQCTLFHAISWLRIITRTDDVLADDKAGTSPAHVQYHHKMACYCCRRIALVCHHWQSYGLHCRLPMLSENTKLLGNK